MQNRFLRSVYTTVILTFIPLYMSAQDDGMHKGTQVHKNLVLGFESAGSFGKGTYAPFWHISNRQGLSSTDSESGLMHLAAKGDMSLPNGIGVDYGLDFGAQANTSSGLFLHQLYVDLSYKWIGLDVGMQERWGELKNRTLSTGGLTWSGNSSPIPQVRLGIPYFTCIPVLGRWFSLKGHVSYGRLTDDKWRKSQAEKACNGNQYTDDLLFHSKAFFVRLGDANRFPLEATIGLEMYSVFGGTLHNRQLYTDDIIDEHRLPSGPDAYLTAFLPFNKVGKQGKENGNILGSWHLSFDYHTEEWGVRAYYEHFYEDHSSMLGIEYKDNQEGNKDFVFYGFRRNWFDALWGIEVNLKKNAPVSNVVLELLNTRGQCGPIYKAPFYPVIEGVDGCDGMYNHELYDSYSLSGYDIGNPILLSPVYNKDYSQRLRSNRVLMYHLGIEGAFGLRWNYRALFTDTAHWGTYEDPLNQVQKVTSCLLEGSYRLGDEYGWKIGLSLGLDYNDGDMIGNNAGFMVTLSKLWKLL